MPILPHHGYVIIYVNKRAWKINDLACDNFCHLGKVWPTVSAIVIIHTLLLWVKFQICQTIERYKIDTTLCINSITLVYALRHILRRKNKILLMYV